MAPRTASLKLWAAVLKGNCRRDFIDEFFVAKKSIEETGTATFHLDFIKAAKTSKPRKGDVLAVANPSNFVYVCEVTGFDADGRVVQARCIGKYHSTWMTFMGAEGYSDGRNLSGFVHMSKAHSVCLDDYLECVKPIGV